MPTIHCDGQHVELAPGEKVLDGLLRAGIAVPHSCRAGTCQSCLMKCTSGPVPPAAQAGLKETLRAQGFFLACAAAPTEDMTVTLDAAAGLRVPARIARIDRLSRDVVRVLLEPGERFEYQSGQFVNLARADGLIRSYSLASLPEDDAHLELHVRRVPSGRMSGWLAESSPVGETVELRGPSGDCFYIPGRPEQDLLLVGTGTGLAPLYGILRDALRHGHTGNIRLFHGAVEPAGLYLVDELKQIAARHANVHYHRCVLRGEAADGEIVEPVDQVLARHVPSPKGMRVFLCGNPEIVQMLRKKLFLAGAKMSDIHADAFVMARS